MAQETEIKLKIADAAAFRRKLKKLRAEPLPAGRVHEVNVIFDTPQGELAKHAQLLRIRTETPESKSAKAKVKPRIVLTFKRPVAGSAMAPGSQVDRGPHKVREELELEVADGGMLTQIFEGLGMQGWFRYEKYRTTYRLPASQGWAKGLLIEFDETPIGNFVELEGPASAIDRVSTELGFRRKDYIVTNYLRLYAEECRRKGVQPGNMVFDPKS